MYPCPYIHSDKRPFFLRGYDAVLMYRRFLILFFLAWQRGGKWVSNIRRNSCDNFFILVRAWAGHLRSSLGETESSIFIWKKIWGMERESVCVCETCIRRDHPVEENLVYTQSWNALVTNASFRFFDMFGGELKNPSLTQDVKENISAMQERRTPKFEPLRISSKLWPD